MQITWNADSTTKCIQSDFDNLQVKVEVYIYTLFEWFLEKSKGKPKNSRSRPLTTEVGRGWHGRRDVAGSYTTFGELDSLPREPLEEWVAPICIYWAASLKDCSSRRVGWPVGAVEKGQEAGQAE